MARMRILTAIEQYAFDQPPVFDHKERKQLLTLPKGLMDIAKGLRTPDSQIGFLLMCGYFKATKRFYQPQDFRDRDIAAAIHQLKLTESAFEPTQYTETTRLRHQRQILDFHGFAPFDQSASYALATEVATMARMHLKLRLIFDRCVDFLIQHRVQVPSAYRLNDLIRAGLHDRKAELIALMDSQLPAEARHLLDDLFTAPDDQNRYRLTLLKKLSQSTSPSRIKEAVADFEVLSELHDRLDAVLSILDLGTAGIRYFAGSVLRSEIFQMQRRERNDRHIHAAAFVAHQFYRCQDNIIDLWFSVMASFKSAASRDYQEALVQERKDQQRQIGIVIEGLERAVFGVLRDIRSVMAAANLSDAEKITATQALLDQGKTDDFSRLKDDLAATTGEAGWHDILEARSVKLQNRLSPLLRALTFMPSSRAAALLEAVDHFRNDGDLSANHAPMGFLDAEQRAAVMRGDGSFRVSLYKVFLFQAVTAAIKSGDLNVERSYKYRPMDAYLIDKNRWHREKARLLERAGLTEFAAPEPILARLNAALTEQYKATNDRAAGNPHLKLRKDGTFHIATPALDARDTDPLGDLFPQRHDVTLAQVLETVNNHCSMLQSFKHWQQTHVRQATSHPALLAGIMGLGCGIGVRKMARISSSVTESELDHTVNWRFSLENIRAANDAVLKAMDEMELPNLYRQTRDQLHTASDGQKFVVRGDSLHASRSFKYFGQGQGVSAYTFVDERNFLWHSLMISAADRESAYVIDGLMHNDVVKSDIHSTDSHGYTEAVFGLTHLLGFSFAPRIKGIGKQTLYIFKPKNQADPDWVIRPDKTINEDAIRDNWDDLLRLVATIKLKENTASDIFRRLNSYSRQHALYQTLKAFGQIIKSLFILRYVDGLALRQAIEKQLNKVELANRFTRAVAVGNPREYTQTEKEEQEIAEGCNRLIRNSIICWNYLYLTRQVEKAPDVGAREILLRLIAAHSPMSWAHINMLGEYDFSEEKLRDTLGILPPKKAA
ncbi:Tn3 family transposase [Roseinatronobacter monicus]|uniref:TnpA family transposase n=1 Tax=Roseinatronobacter monicus TaxID=393481 RepID=A0A543K5V9_9RHOB|nr:Tn3 family transposase [Roseinatronobacter monicus]TQM90460.1 TnpA family transposase [Roseinatronobacter monicus]